MRSSIKSGFYVELRNSLCYLSCMELSYAYKRNPPEAPKQYMDKNGERPDLGCLLGDLREGDVVLVHALSDLGRGRGLTAVRSKIEAAGATVRVLERDKRDPGRPRTFAPNATQDAALRELWLSRPELQGRWLLKAAAEIMGHEVPRHALHNRYGARNQ